LSVKMTRRNRINLAFIVTFSTWTILYFNLSKPQYVGLFLFMMIAPKVFWLSFDFITRVNLDKVAAWFKTSTTSSQSEEVKPEVELVS
jgi:hypothetical protein